MKYRADFYSQALPDAQDILAIFEVADSSLQHDRQVKMPLYANYGIPEYWIIDIDGKVIEFYSSPQGRNYSNQQVFNAGDGISLFGRNMEVKELVAPIL